jgi:predicted unusual protein kinase regulating ubiquinone biosynthesis (AarF/ABC1/UbiB family)
MHHGHAPDSHSAIIGARQEDLFAIAVDQPFRFPATFTFVLRAFSTLEGIGKGLNPDYRFAEVATPYAQELLQLQVSPSLPHHMYCGRQGA